MIYMLSVCAVLPYYYLNLTPILQIKANLDKLEFKRILFGKDICSIVIPNVLWLTEIKLYLQTIETVFTYYVNIQKYGMNDIAIL